MAYPERPQGGRRPARPGEKRNTPSSEHISGRRKSWSSDGSVTDGRADLSPRSGMPWWKSPLMKAERLKRAAARRASLPTP